MAYLRKKSLAHLAKDSLAPLSPVYLRFDSIKACSGNQGSESEKSEAVMRKILNDKGMQSYPLCFGGQFHPLNGPPLTSEWDDLNEKRRASVEAALDCNGKEILSLKYELSRRQHGTPTDPHVRQLSSPPLLGGKFGANLSSVGNLCHMTQNMHQMVRGNPFLNAGPIETTSSMRARRKN